MLKTYSTTIQLEREFLLDILTPEGEDRSEIERLEMMHPNGFIPVNFLVSSVFQATKWLGHPFEEDSLILCDFPHAEFCGNDEGFFGIYYDGLINNIGHEGCFSVVIYYGEQPYSFRIEINALPFAPRQFLDVMRATFSTEDNELKEREEESEMQSRISYENAMEELGNELIEEHYEGGNLLL